MPWRGVGGHRGRRGRTAYPIDICMNMAGKSIVANPSKSTACSAVRSILRSSFGVAACCSSALTTTSPQQYMMLIKYDKFT